MKKLFTFLPSVSWILAALLIPWTLRDVILNYSINPLPAIMLLVVVPGYCLWMAYRDWQSAKQEMKNREMPAHLYSMSPSLRTPGIAIPLTENDLTVLDHILQVLQTFGLAQPSKELLQSYLTEDGLSGDIDAYAVFSVLQNLDKNKEYVSDGLAYSVDQVEVDDATVIEITRAVLKIAGYTDPEIEIIVLHDGEDPVHGSVTIELGDQVISVVSEFSPKYTPTGLLEGLAGKLALPESKILCCENIDSGCVIACLTPTVMSEFNNALGDRSFRFKPL